MAGVGSKLEALLKCTICQDILRKPKTLTCFHSFCEACLGQLEKKTVKDVVGVSCPICRAFSGESTVRNNFLVQELLGTYNDCKTGQQSLCEMCLKQKSDWKCVECKIFLCGNCRTTHVRVPLCRGHHIVEGKAGANTIVDRLVFCEKHTDQPVIFNCRECEMPLCIKCKVTKHETHKTETVEDTLERLLPEMKDYNEKIKALISEVDENKEELEARKTEVTAAFEKSRQDGEAKLNAIIDEATLDYKALVKELDIKEEEELGKLRLDKRTEYQHVIEWMDTCSESARGVTLMEQVQSGLCRRMKEIADMKTISKSFTRVELPSLIENNETIGNVIGEIAYRPSKVLASQVQLDSRNPVKPFAEILRKDLKIENEVTLKGRCTHISVINGEIWAAVPGSNCIQVIDHGGNIQREISCNYQPFSVKQAPWGDIIVASQTGIYDIHTDGTVKNTVTTEKSSDIIFLNDEIIAINHRKKVLQSFSKSADGTWAFKGDIKASEGLASCEEDTLITNGETIMFTMRHSSNLTVYQCDGKTGNRICNTSGQLTMKNPFLCGVDPTGTMLVADCANKVFQTCDAENRWKVWNIPCIASRHPVDFLYFCDTDDLWVLLYSTHLVKLG